MAKLPPADSDELVTMAVHPLFAQPDGEPARSEWRPVPIEHLAGIFVYALQGITRMPVGKYDPSEIGDVFSVQEKHGGGRFCAVGLANSNSGKQPGSILAQAYFTLPGALRLPPPPPPVVDPHAAALVAAPPAAGHGVVDIALAVLTAASPFLLRMQDAAATREARAQELADAREARAQELAAAHAAEARAAAAAANAAAAAQHATLVQALVARPAAVASEGSGTLSVFLEGMKHGKENAPTAPAPTSLVDDLAQLAQFAPMVAGVLRGMAAAPK